MSCSFQILSFSFCFYFCFLYLSSDPFLSGWSLNNSNQYHSSSNFWWCYNLSSFHLNFLLRSVRLPNHSYWQFNHHHVHVHYQNLSPNHNLHSYWCHPHHHSNPCLHHNPHPLHQNHLNLLPQYLLVTYCSAIHYHCCYSSLKFRDFDKDLHARNIKCCFLN